MNNYLISYDLHSPHQDYSSLINKIKTAPYWAKVNDSAWFIKSPLTTMQIVNQLEQEIDHNDVVFVAEMSSCGWSKSLDQDVQSFIFNNWNA